MHDLKLLEWLQAVFPDAPAISEELGRAIADHPDRISKAYRSLLSGYLIQPENVVTVTLEIPNESHTGLVSSIQIPFLSLCAHHFLPFFGTIDIVYEPGPYIIGIGKMPRLVECRAKRFQIQEVLVKCLCEDMMNFAKAKGVYVRSSARHACVCYRGPEKFTTVNQTTYAMGSLAGAQRLPEIFALLTAPNL